MPKKDNFLSTARDTLENLSKKLTPQYDLWQDSNSIELKSVKAAYGDIEVIHGLDLKIEAGTIFGMFGPNGGGKSTLLKIISSLLPPTNGEVLLGGIKTNTPEVTIPTEALAQNGLCLIPEGKGIFPNLSVAENLRIQTQLGHSGAEIENTTLTHFPQLKDKMNRLAGTLSGGEQQMLSLSRALTTSPSILLLDELSTGLAPIIVSKLYEIVAQVATQGTTILIVEQSAPAVIDIVEKAGIMVNGLIQKIGDPAEINKELAAAYLGTDK